MTQPDKSNSGSPLMGQTDRSSDPMSDAYWLRVQDERVADLEAERDYYRTALEKLRSEFEREALARYHAGLDGSDWQEAHRRVEVALRVGTGVER